MLFVALTVICATVSAILLVISTFFAPPLLSGPLRLQTAGSKHPAILQRLCLIGIEENQQGKRNKKTRHFG